MSRMWIWYTRYKKRATVCATLDMNAPYKARVKVTSLRDLQCFYHNCLTEKRTKVQ